MRRPSVHEPSAYLDALYKVNQGSVTLPAIEPTLTIDAAAPLAHMRHHQLHQRQRREEIQLEHAARVVERRAPGRRIHAHAGVVDQDVDRAEALERASRPRAGGSRRP